MQFIAKLKFTAPLHIGVGKPNYYADTGIVLHSDTIKSAIFSTGLLLTDDYNKDFWDSFIVSSAMPFYKDKLFLPKPNFNNIKFKIWDDEKNDYLPADDLKFHKKIKKVKFIEQSLFEQFNSGQEIELEDYQFVGDILWAKETVEEIVKDNFNPKDKDENEKLKKEFEKFDDNIKRQIIKDNLEKVKIYKKGIQERVKIYTIPEKEEEKLIFSRPYSLERIYFNDDAGLYFIVEICEDAKLQADKIIEKINKALKILCDFGFGTDKSVGNGQFEFSIVDKFELKQPKTTEYKMNLSLFLPENTEDIIPYLYRYNLIERGGYIANYADMDYNGYLRNTITMFDVGAVFKSNLSDTGKYENVKPDANTLPTEITHPVWREGRSIFLNLNFKLSEN